ncbi:antibiotic biosynthesis monooxygenase [Kangiella sp. HZ709]|uniref:antibiotic biosynthesis monooxygenase family protein n=1 Tax=Kangiella sp. HZ709 TaxID=2666328 RepID=UPI0012B08B6B|nr:antibiotic biosynthesis monooxygenase [Kangiella sp. HZ709]MRX28208.1 antibiotic biosynthesis monooxygenase [Kangiella sp. HZ709]
MIRVIIERAINPKKVEEYHGFIRKAKNKASNVPGFLSGELLNILGKTNQVIVMSCWDSLEAWEIWAESEQRLELLEAMRPLLESDEKVTILESTNIK